MAYVRAITRNKVADRLAQRVRRGERARRGPGTRPPNGPWPTAPQAPAPKAAARADDAREAAPPAAGLGPDGYGATARSRLAGAAAERGAGTVALGRDASATVDRASAGERVTLRVPVPASSGDRLEVRIVTADGRREMRARVDRPGGADAVLFAVPAAWLEPGTYAVEVRGAAAGEPPIATYALSVP